MELQAGEAVSALVFTVGQRACALPLRDISEVMRPLPIESVAGAPNFVPGVAIIRGAALPVVDLGMLLERRSQRAWGRFVTVKVGGARSVALAVDEVVGVRSLEGSQLAALPPLLRAADGDLIEALGAADAQLLVVLRAARLVPEEVWASLAVEMKAR